MMQNKNGIATLSWLLLFGLLAACGGQSDPTPTLSAPTAAAQAATAETAPPTAVALPTDAAPPATAADTPPAPTAAAETPSSLAEAGPLALFDDAALADLLLVVTPPQGEGPYYPVAIPADADNDLTVVAGEAGEAQGDVLLLGGYVVDALGRPLPGAVVEIWQTDAGGVYLHPGDPAFARRDSAFQGFGASVTGADGSYFFRTILPGRYEPRPQHIHVKVWVDGREVLTTQFYFVGDPQLARDGLAQAAGDALDALVITVGEGVDGDNRPVLLAVKHIVLDR